METYYAARDAWLSSLEHETRMYPAEMEAFAEANPRPLFKAHLIDQRRGWWWEDRAAA